LRVPPIFSGSEVVAAATMPPVCQCASALSVTSERRIASETSSPCGSFDDHASHCDTTCSSAADASGAGRSSRQDGCHVSVNASSSPCAISKSPTVRRPSPRSSSGVASVRRSGPAMKCSRPSSWRETHGTTAP